jgi:hypothetical protein
VRFALKLGGADVKFNHGGYATRDPSQLGYRFEGVRPKFFGDRNVFLHRNPIDTAVSEYYQIHNRIFNKSHPNFDDMKTRLSQKNNLPPDDLDDFVLHPVWGCNKVSDFNRAHINYFTKKKNCKIVSYEELRGDPKSVFSTLLDFFQVKNYDIDKVIKTSSFESMREIELNSNPEERKKHALYGKKDNDENTLKVRRGKVNGYLDSLKPETIDEARRICGEYGFQP